MDFDKIYKRIMIILFVAVGIIGLIVAIRLGHKGYSKDIDYQFYGVVDSVSYDIKGYASIVVNGSHFYLGASSWDFDNNIQKGDSIIKKRNSMIIKLIKPDGRVVFEGKER